MSTQIKYLHYVDYTKDRCDKHVIISEEQFQQLLPYSGDLCRGFWGDVDSIVATLHALPDTCLTLRELRQLPNENVIEIAIC